MQLPSTTSGVVPKYGENLKRLRLLAKVSQETVAQRMGLKRQGNLPSYENGDGVPEAETIRQHAAAIGCDPADLLRGVVTEFDRIRWPGLTDAQREALLVGMAALPPAQLEALARTGAPPPRSQTGSSPDPVATPVTPATASHKHRGKRQA